MHRTIRTVDDVMGMLDRLFAPDADRWTEDASGWWDGFYADRGKPVPFFVAKPDENLVSYLDRGLLTPGRALDLGCGPGRNAVHLASYASQAPPVTVHDARRGVGGPSASKCGADVPPTPTVGWPARRAHHGYARKPR
jgi:SAM-dependent methyltransferase